VVWTIASRIEAMSYSPSGLCPSTPCSPLLGRTTAKSQLLSAKKRNSTEFWTNNLCDDKTKRGYNALATHEARQLGRGDREQRDYARQEQRAILTHNRDDFLALAKEYALHGIPHAGVLYVPQAPSR
jgi:Domain of unknown function (DUF5615)